MASDLYNFGPLNFYQTPNERWTAGSFINYDINTHVNVYAEVMYMHNSSQAQIAPSGDFFNPSFIPCADPLLTPQEVCDHLHAGEPRGEGQPDRDVQRRHLPGINMYIGRRNVEGGNRIATFVTNSSREVLGVKGDFGDAWTYDVYAQHDLVDNNNGNLNYLNNTAIQEALNVLPGPAERRSAADPPTRSVQARSCLRRRRRLLARSRLRSLEHLAPERRDGRANRLPVGAADRGR